MRSMQKKRAAQTAMSRTPIALAVTRSCDDRKRYIAIGMVARCGRYSRYVAPISPMDRAKANVAPTRMPGAIIGNSMNRNVFERVAPRLIAASVMFGVIFRSSGATERITNGYAKMTCAKTMAYHVPEIRSGGL